MRLYFAAIEKLNPPPDSSLEILRGLAACMVMFTHYIYMITPHPGLWGFCSTGVNLFFVLSGYVFAPHLHGRAVTIVPHLIRRFFRVFPMYWLALVIYSVLRLLQGQPLIHLPEHLFMLHTLQSVEVARTYNIAFWSLPPEVEFYFFLPALAWLASRITFTSVLVAALVLKLVLVASAEPPGGALTARAIATIHLPGLLCEFMLGAWAWYKVRTASAIPCRLFRALAGLVVLMAALALYGTYIADFGGSSHIQPPNWLSGTMGFWAAIGYALLLSAVAGWLDSRQPVLAAPLWIGLGQCSYGIYLLHNAVPSLLQMGGWFVTGWPQVMVCTAITLLASWLIHCTYEQPMRQWGRALAQHA